jgi:hypothetical protein
MKITDFAESFGKYAKTGFKNVSPEKKAERLNICNSCEHFINLTKQCGICGCFLSLKASWASEKCPTDKWQSEIEINEEPVDNSNPVNYLYIPTQNSPIEIPTESPMKQKDCGCNKNV